jgi:hypothetical protein
MKKGKGNPQKTCFSILEEIFCCPVDYAESDEEIELDFVGEHIPMSVALMDLDYVNSQITQLTELDNLIRHVIEQQQDTISFLESITKQNEHSGYEFYNLINENEHNTSLSIPDVIPYYLNVIDYYSSPFNTSTIVESGKNQGLGVNINSTNGNITFSTATATLATTFPLNISPLQEDIYRVDELNITIYDCLNQIHKAV